MSSPWIELAFVSEMAFLRIEIGKKLIGERNPNLELEP